MDSHGNLREGATARVNLDELRDIMQIDVSNVQTHDIKDVSSLFGLPLNSYEDIDEFTKDFELGKIELWSILTKEKHDEITDILCNKWDALLKSFSEDGLSIIASNIEDVLQESLTISVPLIEETGFTIETVTIENGY
ncbi:hypothetical protein Tco_1145471 [Tanacetum coccineum]